MLIYTVISVTALVTVHYTPFTKKRENFKKQFLRSFLVTKENIRFILPHMIYILLSILYTHEVHAQVHASVFFCTFLCRQARLRRESAYFHALQSYFPSVNSPPGKLANRTKPSFIRQLCLCLEIMFRSTIWQSGMSAKKIPWSSCLTEKFAFSSCFAQYASSWQLYERSRPPSNLPGKLPEKKYRDPRRNTLKVLRGLTGWLIRPVKL